MLKNPNIGFKTRISHTQIKSKTKCEFFELIIKACALYPNLELRIPETIIKISASNSACMIFTKEEGFLFCKQNLKSSYEHRFMKRCYYFQRPKCPVTVVKYSSDGIESVKPVMSIKETYTLWKSLKTDVCIIQRYIYPFNNAPIRTRVDFSVPDFSFTKRTTKRPVDLYITEKSLGQDRFLALGEIGDDTNIVEENLQIQMQALKKIIEIEEIRNQVVSFISADFVQDYEQNWFFVSLISYRFETILPKIITQGKKVRVMSKCNKSMTNLNNEKRSLRLSSSMMLKDLLTQEALRDLCVD